MKVLVFGGREFDDWRLLNDALTAVHNTRPISCIIEGEAKGADFLGRVWAKFMGMPVDPYPADWNTHGRAAGHIRNQQMLDQGKPNYAVGFPGGSGTTDMLNRLNKAGVPVWDLTQMVTTGN